MADQVFDESFYLATYPDVARAVADGTFSSARSHFESFGKGEGRVGSPDAASTAPNAPDWFDEAWYLDTYPDVAQSVAAGRLASGFVHWVESGRSEGRLAPPRYDEGTNFDDNWYLASYHLAAGEIAAGRAADARQHYLTIGRFRGYLPNRYAPRPDDPAGIDSAFGGFWVDHGNAADLVAGRLELGRITAEQAVLLDRWIADGFVILPQAVPHDMVDRAAADLHRAYAGGMNGALFQCPAIAGNRSIPWDPALRDQPAKALDLHWICPAILDLIFAPPIREFLELVFERRALATQSLGFLRGSAQGYHQDTLYVPFTLPRQFVASWIALEDVVPGGGELTYYPGSHRLPDMLYADRFKTMWDASRMLRRYAVRGEAEAQTARLEQACQSAGLAPQRFLARKGDVLLWHADLVHGGLPIAPDKTRASVVSHYCPKEVAALTFERGSTALRFCDHGSAHATGVYEGF